MKVTLKFRLGLCAAFSIIAIVLYAPSLSGPWQYDDYAQILDKPVLTARSASGFLASAFRILPDSDGRITNRDAVRATFRANWDWWGEKPLGYRVMNILIHAAAAVLVSALTALLLKKMTNDELPARSALHSETGGRMTNEAFNIPCPQRLRHRRRRREHSTFIIFSLAGLLFLVHPIQSQAVAYIAQRFTSMAAFFFILAAICWLAAILSAASHRRPLRHAVFWGWYAGAILAAILSSASKEIAVTLPAILLLAIVAARLGWDRRSGGAARRTLRTGILLVPFLLIAAKIPAQVVWSSLNGDLANLTPESGHTGLIGDSLSVTQTNESLTRHDYFLTQIQVVRTYLRLIVLPVGQSLDWEYPLSRRLDGATAATAALHLGLIGLGGWLLLGKKSGSSRMAGLGILWFYVTILPESSVVPIIDMIYEHRVYLPFVGVCLALAGTASAATSAIYKSYRTYVKAAAILWLLLLSAATMRRAYVWGDEVRLWADVWAKAPNKPRANKNYGVVLAAHRSFDRGIERLLRAVELDAENADYRSNLGTAYLQAGRYADAAPNFRRAYDLLAAELKLPDYTASLDLLATADLSDLSQKNRRQLAQYLNDYGVCMVQLNRGDEALDAFKKSLFIDPSLYSARLGVGAAYNVLGDTDAAIRAFEELIRDDPSVPDAYHNAAVMYKKAGRMEDHDRVLKAAKAAGVKN